METLHAPWRIEYILGPKKLSSDVSLFTQIARSQDDESNYVVGRTHHGFAVLNTYPYNCGHVLIIPYKQIADLDDLSEEENLDLIKLLQKTKRAIQSTMSPDGFNVGLNLGSAAGAGIGEHLHWHIIPRWNGDTNFMPAIGQTSVLPEALSETAKKLRAAMLE
jgi:ATP adenylyltransferase